MTGPDHLKFKVLRGDSIPDIITMLRGAADLLEASHRPKADG